MLWGLATQVWVWASVLFFGPFLSLSPTHFLLVYLGGGIRTVKHYGGSTVVWIHFSAAESRRWMMLTRSIYKKSRACVYFWGLKFGVLIGFSMLTISERGLIQKLLELTKIHSLSLMIFRVLNSIIQIEHGWLLRSFNFFRRSDSILLQKTISLHPAFCLIKIAKQITSFLIWSKDRDSHLQENYTACSSG